MNWTFNRAGQWEGLAGPWSALVARNTGQVTWSAYVSLTNLPSNRQERHGFVDIGAARAWCEAEIKRLQGQ